MVFLLALLALLAICGCATARASAPHAHWHAEQQQQQQANQPQPQPPNLVLIIVDDYGHTDIGYHNENYDNLLRTPTLDALAADGVKLEGYYVQPICTPTRSQLLSGRYQIHTGLQHSVIHPNQPYGLPTDIPLLTDRLIERGYVCHKVSGQ